MQVAVVAVAPVVLVWAASTAMLGLSRHTYVLATNRQIPSWLGKLGRRWTTPHVAILAAALIAFGLVIPGDVMFLGGLYAFGATIAFTIAHVSVVRLRMTDPDRERPFRVPLNVRFRGAERPAARRCSRPALTVVAWVSVLLFHDEARYIGGAWMVFGLVAYVIYRVGVEKTSLTKRVERAGRGAGQGRARRPSTAGSWCPCSARRSTTTSSAPPGGSPPRPTQPGETPPHLEVVYVLDAAADRAAGRAAADGADGGGEPRPSRGRRRWARSTTRSRWRPRSCGRATSAPGSSQAARERDIDLIVMGAEPPTQIRGGAVLGGVGGSRPAEIGPVTEYVLRKAPCRVLLTAPGRGRGRAAGVRSAQAPDAVGRRRA